MSSTSKSRTYTEDQKIAALTALRANAGNISKTARQLSIPRKTLSQWSTGVAGVKSIENLAEKVDENCITLADKFEALANMLVDAAPEKIAEAKLQPIVTSAAIATDKAQLLRGQPTSISENRNDRARLEASIKSVIDECAKEGVEVTKIEAASLLKEQLPADAAILDKIIAQEVAPKA